jgi:hypothetical protein
MSDLSGTSCCRDNRKDNGFSPILLILVLCLCGGDSGGLFGGCGGQNDCGCNGGGGLDGILPLILILCLCGGGSFF